jgi:uncharacterized membrane protein
VLPWIGVIAQGYVIGPWFRRSFAAERRGQYLLVAGFCFDSVHRIRFARSVAWQRLL